MQLDPRTKTYAEMVEAYVIRYGRTDTPEKMAADLIAYDMDLRTAEKRIAELEAQVVSHSSAGLMYRDTSHLYPHSPRYKKPVPDPVDDEWIKTGREAA